MVASPCAECAAGVAPACVARTAQAWRRIAQSHDPDEVRRTKENETQALVRLYKHFWPERRANAGLLSFDSADIRGFFRKTALPLFVNLLVVVLYSSRNVKLLFIMAFCPHIHGMLGSSAGRYTDAVLPKLS